MLNRFFAILLLVGLAFATADEGYLPACRAVEAAISDASNIYYPGQSDRPSSRQDWTSRVGRRYPVH